MSGVTWRHRKDGDWLASNGRWYPKNTYPRGWDRTALPPAPGHGPTRSVSDIVSSAAVRMQELAGSVVGDNNGDATPPTFSPGTTNHSHTDAAPVRTTPPPSSPAPATVTSTRTHVSRVGAGDPAPLGLPPAPGRVSPDAPDLTDSEPPPPARPSPSSTADAASTTSASVVRPPMPGVSDDWDKSGQNLVVRDLGKVFGSARRRIEKAIEETE